MPVSLPKTTFNIQPGVETISNAPQKVLIVGQKTSAGSATSGALQKNIQNNSEEDTLFGENSMLAGMIRAYKKVNQITRIDAIGLDDNGSTFATGSVGVVGTATEDGEVVITIGSRKNHKFIVAITSGDVASVIAAAIDTAVDKDLKVPIGSNANPASVDFTAINAGTVGNRIGIQVEGSVAGVTFSVTAMTGGATDPVLTNVLDVVGEDRYQTIVAPSEYGADFLTDFLDPRFNATNIIQDGVGGISETDTLSNLITFGTTENSKSLFVIGNKTVNKTLYKGSALFELNYAISSQIAAARALRLTDGANINDIVVAAASLDNFGGIELASLPYFNTIFPNLPLIDIDQEWTQTEMESLKAAGISVLGNNSARTSIVLSEVVTTRKTDDVGNPETTFKFLNAVDTSSVIREFFFNNNKARFAQSRLTDGDLVPGRSIANEGLLRATQLEFYDSLAGVLTVSGELARIFFSENLVITLDLDEGKVTMEMKVPIVSQLREIVATMNIVFSTNS